MDNSNLLSSVFRTSSAVIVPLILAACIVCQWPLSMTVLALSAAVVISSPATISLHLFLWVSRKGRGTTGFLWMLLLSSIPVGSLVVAELFACYVPGRPWIVLLLASVSGYASLFRYSLSVSQFFNPSDHEREKNDLID